MDYQIFNTVMGSFVGAAAILASCRCTSDLRKISMSSNGLRSPGQIKRPGFSVCLDSACQG